ncbi:MAG: penicillin-binding protein 2 [Robiginitomaculum sp.]|nr:penicillin-binding protein 2 [Robiginitomaculum sp.]MDQ7077808.1 penicillin-binding protein 2 [Robiginitomaculum sp.]
MAKAGRYTIPLADVERIDAAELFSISGEQREAVRAARPRLMLMALIFAFGYSVLMVRSVSLTIFDHQSVSVKNRVAASTQVPRAKLTDRNGELLASSIETYSAYIARANIRNADRLARQLSAIKGLASEEILRARLEGKKGRARLGHRLTPAVRDAIFSLGLPGVEFVPELTRYYPRGQFAAHVLGWVNADGRGTAGAERAFAEQLQDKNTKTLALSLDTRVQFALESELQTAMTEFRPEAALGIVTNIKTGEVLAMAGRPTFSPNAPGKASPRERRNRAATDRYELGSVFKPLTLAMGFDQGLIKPDELFDVVRPLVVSTKQINDMHHSRHKMSVREILIESSNKGAALIALRVGGEKQRQYLADFGLLDAAKIELKESARPYMSSRQWRAVKTATIGYGHGITVTPLAFVQAMGAVANGGHLVPLTLLARPPGYRPEGRDVISPMAAKTVIDIMREVVTKGTGKNANVEGFDVAGKTGSAEKLDPKTGRYVKDRNISSFVAIFPAHNPQYLVFILLDEPKGDVHTGGWETAGWNAAPVAGRVIGRIGPVLLPLAKRTSLMASNGEKNP